VVADWLIDTPEVVERSVAIPDAVIRGRTNLRIAFHFANPASPSELGESLDSRRLGLGFQTLVLRTTAVAT